MPDKIRPPEVMPEAIILRLQHRDFFTRLKNSLLTKENKKVYPSKNPAQLPDLSPTSLADWRSYGCMFE
jgi:hypothetical protein